MMMTMMLGRSADEKGVACVRDLEEQSEQQHHRDEDHARPLVQATRHHLLFGVCRLGWEANTKEDLRLGIQRPFRPMSKLRPPTSTQPL